MKLWNTTCWVAFAYAQSLGRRKCSENKKKNTTRSLAFSSFFTVWVSGPSGMGVGGEKGRPSLGPSHWILTLIRSHPSPIWGSLSRAVPPLAVLPMPACVFLCSLKDHHLLATSGLYAHFVCPLLGVLSCCHPPCTRPEFPVALHFLFADAIQLNDTWRGLCWPVMDFLHRALRSSPTSPSVMAVAKSSDLASKAIGV